MKRFTALMVLFAVTVVCLSTTGCWRDYDEAEYLEISPNETGFLLPLEGDVSKQEKFRSLEMLKEMQVAAKRVQITHRWHKTGRSINDSNGKWITNVRLVKVDRFPVTREWTSEKSTGTSDKDQGLWAESKDSVGFSTGFSVTSMITEEDAALFLYRYSGKTLPEIMDTEVRARVQADFADFCAEYEMSSLRDEKKKMIDTIRGDIIPFFKERGITITTVGQFGGFAYENPRVQEEIDKVFISQRAKEVAKALLEAQKDINLRIEMEANAVAEKERRIASGTADGKRLILEVAKDAAQNPVFLEMRRLEVEEQRIQKWDGKYPTFYMGSSLEGKGGPGLLLNVSTPAASPVGNLP